MRNEEKWDVPDWLLILALALAAGLFILAGPGCYCRTVRYTSPARPGPSSSSRNGASAASSSRTAGLTC